MDTGSFIFYIKREDINIDIAKKKKKKKSKQVSALMKDELRPKTNCCLADDNDKNKKAKVMKKCVIKQKL